MDYTKNEEDHIIEFCMKYIKTFGVGSSEKSYFMIDSNY